MKKKSLLISGLLFLGAAIGFTSYAVSSGLPGFNLIAEGDEEEPGVVSPKSLTPQSHSYWLASMNINEAVMEFDAPVTLNTGGDLTISLWLDTSSYNGASYDKKDEWSLNDDKHIKVDGNKLIISFGENLGNGTYYIDVPEGVVTVNGLPNRAYDHTNADALWTFTISDPITPSPSTEGICYPADGAKVPETDNVKQLWLNFKTGDSPIAINTGCSGKVVIKKDGEVLYELSPANKNEISNDFSWTGRLVMTLPNVLTAGSYTVEVPEAIVQAGALNSPYSWSFSIQAEIPYEVSLKSGDTYSFSQFGTVTLTWPEGTKLALNPDVSASASLTSFNSGKSATVTDYKAAVEGNVVTLTSEDLSKMVVLNNAKSKYLTLVIPAGLVTVGEGEDAYQNSKKEISQILSAAFVASDFKFVPAIGATNVTWDDLETISIICPENSEFVINNTPTASPVICYLYNGHYTGTGTVSGTYQYNYIYESYDPETHTIVAKRAAAGQSTSNTNNPALFQNGEYSIRVNQNIVQVAGQTANKNGYMNIPAYDAVGGLTTSPIYSSTPANGRGVTSITGLTLNFAKKVVVNNENAEITLSYGGNVICSVKAGETTTKTAKAGAAGSQTVAFANLFKVDGEAITAPGVYTYKVPADAFVQAESPAYKNADIDITAYIFQNIDCEVYPKEATFSGSTSNLVATPGTEFDELTEITFTYPANATIELIPGWKYQISTGGVNAVSASDLLKNPITSSFTISNSTSSLIGDIKVDGNKITFVLNPPYRRATPANGGLGFLVPQGLFIVNVPGEDGKVTQYANAKIVKYYQGIPMYPGRLGILGTDAATGKAVIQYLSEEENYMMVSDLNSILYTGYETLYPDKTKPLATLLDEHGEVIANYEGKAADSDIPGVIAAMVQFTPVADDAEKVAQLGNGTYTFVIKEHTLQAGDDKPTSTWAAFNNKDFKYEINALKTSLVPAVENGTKVEELSSIKFSFSNVQMLLKNPDVKPFVYFERKITEGIFKGDKEKVDITTEGYTVELKVPEMENEPSLLAMDDDVNDPMGNIDAVAELVITPALTTPNTYYVQIPAGALLLQTVVPSPVIDLNYQVVPFVPAKDLLVPGSPESFDFTLDTEENPFGMGMLMFGAPADMTLNTESTEKAVLKFGDEVIAEIGAYVAPAEEETPEIQADEDEDEQMPVGIIEMPNSEGKSFVFSFVNTADEAELAKFMKQGKYTLEIPTGLFTYQTNPVKASDFVYNMKVLLPAVEFNSVFSLATPATQEFAVDESYGALVGRPMGMGIISLNFKEGLVLNTESDLKAELYYGDKLIATAGTGEGEDGGMMIKSVVALADDDLPTYSAHSVLVIAFNTTGSEEFLQPGEYKVVFPAGIFEIAEADGNAPVMAGQLNYTMTPTVPKVYTYTITPDNGTEFVDMLAGTVILTVDGASFLDYDDSAPGVFTDPNGNKIMFKSSYPVPDSNTLTWSLEENPNKPINWVNGTYTFTIKANTIWVNAYSDGDAPANFPAEDIVVTYIVKDLYTAVALIGIDAADSYNVYTVDGKAVLLNGNADQLIELESGLYIINGKKAYIRK